MYVQQMKDINGDALGTPDTWHKISKIGDISFDRKSTQVTIPMGKSNALGEEIYPVISNDLRNEQLLSQPPDMTITCSMIESSLAHLSWYDTIRGTYWCILFPLPNHGGGLISYVAFVEIESAGKVDVSASKTTEIPLSMIILRNMVAITPNMTGLTDPLVGTISPTIALYQGQVWVAGS